MSDHEPSLASDAAAKARQVLTRNERWAFRLMAAHPDIVEAEIAKGTDEHPVSRAQVMRAIRAHRLGTTPEALADERRTTIAELTRRADDLEALCIELAQRVDDLEALSTELAQHLLDHMRWHR